ncbi:MAG: acyl-CoA dehydrogenase [Polyangiaceae bacterium]|nr:acyl-CoA dehydrogenase [Polyangiaceae bacterium]
MPEPVSLAELIAVDHLLTEEEKLVAETVRRFVRERYLPRAADLFAKEEFPTDLIPEMAEMGLLGAALKGYGCAGMTPAAYGLALEELEYGDSGLRSFASVQGSLAMYPIYKFGSEAQKERWLPKMAKGEIIGCFGLTEPDAGSDPAAMKTNAKRDGKDWILNGTKMWITSSPVAKLAVVWAKTDGDDPKSIRGFVVERGMKGFETPTVHGKMSLRASPTGEIVLSDVRVPEENVLPNVEGLRGPLSCLTQARFGISFGALGAARACFDSVLSYTRERVAFGKPIAGKQLVQKKISDMAIEIAKGKIMAVHFARLKEKKDLLPAQVSLCKKNNVGIALEIARTARSLLAGNGILLEYPVIRHMLNLESVFTYEGTDEVHTLILGQSLTGISAF